MATQVQRRKGTTVQHSTFTGASAELTVDTTKNTVVVHDGATAGGFPLAKESGSALSPSSLSLPNGTANAVPYLNGSKVLTSGGALTFDGTNLATSGSIISSTAPAGGSLKRDVTSSYLSVTGGTAPNSNGATILLSGSTYAAANTAFVDATESVFRSLSGASEYMRLTSTGLGIGTSSPAAKLDVRSGTSPNAANILIGYSGSTNYYDANTQIWQSGASVERMRLDSSGNLGLGVTPSAWGSNYKAIQNNNFSLATDGTNNDLSANRFINSGGTSTYIANGFASIFRQEGGVFRFFTAPSGTAGNAITFTQAMTLDASGNLGVGTTSPSSAFGFSRVLELAGTTTALVLNPSNTTSGGGIEVKGAAPLRFTIDNTERARIDSSGNLLVGTTDGSGTSGVGVKFITSSAGIQAAQVTAQTTNAGGTAWNYYSTGAAAFRFYVGAGGTVFATTTTISAISDIRFKENVRDLDSGLAEVMALKPRLYDWKKGKGADIKNARGFIAQEFEQVFPDLIDEWRDPAPEGEDPYKSVRQDLVPTLVKAIQEQQTLIAALQADVAALKAAA